MALRRSNQRQGFSLIELLVVIAIIAVLLALLVTGVQKVREASKRVACMNNMRQIGAGFHSYHQVNKELPTEARDNPSFYKQLLPFVEEQNASDSTQVNLYLCPSRRDGAVGPNRDYGYAASAAAGNHGPSILDQDMDSKASKAVGVSLETINSYNGASSITLLTHVWMAPSSYGTDASRWADKDNSRTNVAAKFDKDTSGDSSYLGGPHPLTTPTLFVDGHVENISYASTQWADYWAYLTQDSSGDGAQGRWVRVWHPGSGDATAASGSSSGSAATSGSSSAAGNPIGPVNSSTATQVTGGNGVKQDTTNGTSTVLIPQTSYGSPNNQNSPSSRTSSDSTNDPNKSRDKQYQDNVDAEAAKQAAQLAQQKANAKAYADGAKSVAAKAQQQATQAAGDVGKVPAAKQAQAQQLADQAQQAANQAQQASDQAQTAAQNPDANSAAQAAQQSYSTAYNAQQAAQNYLNQVNSLIQQPTTTTTVTPSTTTTSTTTTSSTPTTTTTTTSNTNTNTSTTATNNTSTSSGSGGGNNNNGGSGNDGWYSWVFIPW